MEILEPKELLDIKRLKEEKLLGLDLGKKTIGLSLSDYRLKIASPYIVIKRAKWKEDLNKLLEIIKEEKVFALVIGLPKNMDGSEGPRCQSVRDFAKNFLSHKDITICFWDERLSTVAVTRALLEADLSRSKRSRVVDKMAAAYILQGLLDYINQ